MADECINYDAMGEEEETGDLYGILVSPSTPPSDFDGHGLQLKYGWSFTNASGEGRYPYSNHDVFRRDIWICGPLTDRREDFGEWLVRECMIPSAARDDTVRLVFDHPELMCQHVRIETIYVPREHHDREDDDETETDEDEDEDDELFLEDYEEVLRQSMEDHCRLTPASVEALNALENVTIRAGDEKETCCAVCLEDLSLGLEVTKMPCSHTFHGDCILRWLEYQCVCPLCRFELPRAC